MMSVVLAATMLFSYIGSPVADMRVEPKKNAEIVSQAYYSEQVHVLEESGEWAKIKTHVDQYAGWIKKSSLCQRTQPFLSKPDSILAQIHQKSAHVYEVQDTIYGPLLTLPFESKLEVLEPKQESDSRWLKVALVDGCEGYIQRGAVTLNPPHLTIAQVCQLSTNFQGLPYTWGGRSSFGYDCSGFAQMLYRQMGYYLPRDAKDQAHWEGFEVIPIEKLKAGDLVFFGRSADKISHVGFYLGNDGFMHATVAENRPYIHISSLKDNDWNASGLGRFAFNTARTLKVRQ